MHLFSGSSYGPCFVVLNFSGRVRLLCPKLAHNHYPEATGFAGSWVVLDQQSLFTPRFGKFGKLPPRVREHEVPRRHVAGKFAKSLGTQTFQKPLIEEYSLKYYRNLIWFKEYSSVQGFWKPWVQKVPTTPRIREPVWHRLTQQPLTYLRHLQCSMLFGVSSSVGRGCGLSRSYLRSSLGKPWNIHASHIGNPRKFAKTWKTAHTTL